MRLERLDVTGFGRLRDARLDLAPRLTVLLGDNEAGKSTVLRAIRAALYGVDAGGQGRAIADSDWTRWAPWDGGAYGLALTYALASGRRYRVARRLEVRERLVVQVQELGGRDVTDSLRSGRAVTPGRHHLGIEEAVFCASAWLGEEALDPESADGLSRHADDVQQCIERLADSASRATAAEALARLRAATERVGTERARSTALGAATARLRTLDAQIEEARGRVELLAGERERLRALEERAAAAAGLRGERERAWLVGRLAQLAAHRQELVDALEAQERLEAVIDGCRRHAAFPVEREERVTALGGELRQATIEAAEAGERWRLASQRLRDVERRRMELATSIRALGRVPRVTSADLEGARDLATQLAGEAAVERRWEAVQAADARCSALHREIASTGLGSVPAGRADEVAELLVVASGAGDRLPLRSAASGLVLLGIVLAGLAAAAGRHALAVVLGGVAGAAAGGLWLLERLGGGPAAQARRRLGSLCPGLDLSTAGITRAAEALPAVRALHDDLARQELIAETGRSEMEAASARVRDLADRCRVLAARIPVEIGRVAAPSRAGVERDLAEARAALAAVEGAAEAGRRLAELEAEDGRLGEEEVACRAVHQESERRRQVRDGLAEELANALEAAGLPPETDPARSVAAFREACAVRRQGEEAAARLVEVRRRVQVLGAADLPTFERQATALAEELRRRGGDPALVSDAEPLDAAALAQLESEAEHARQDAQAAEAEAAALRERLAGALDSLPVIADLEDERVACQAVRDRCLRQIEALRCATGLIEEAARRVHRDVAPRLAASVGRRLSLVTAGRYAEADVDAERFAICLRSPDRPDLVPLSLLSRGTRDQVGLLLRIGLAEVLGDAGEPVPLLLDDPLLTADPVRRREAVDFLIGLSEETQVVLATAEPDIAERVARAGLEGCAVVDLDRCSTPAGERLLRLAQA